MEKYRILFLLYLAMIFAAISIILFHLAFGHSPAPIIMLSKQGFGNATHIENYNATFYINPGPSIIKFFAETTPKPDHELDEVQRLINHPKRPVSYFWYSYDRWAAILLAHPELSYPDFIDPNGRPGFFTNNEAGRRKGTIDYFRAGYIEDESTRYMVTFDTTKEASKLMDKYFNVKNRGDQAHCKIYVLQAKNVEKVIALMDVQYLDLAARQKAEEINLKKTEDDLDKGIIPPQPK